ncbi:MAG: metal ABC transporter permease [Alphaproteobacteria bacterium]|nr:metal ABC transporter permease [Alphaproteobacteria bacterium]
MALAGCIALAFGGAPIGVFLVLRRTSLIGDALSHAILPGVAIAFVFAGFSVLWMTIGGLLAGLATAILAGVATRMSAIREDASLAAFFIISLAFGSLLVASFGTDEELVHVLFGRVLELKAEALLTIAGIATVTMAALALLYRPLIAECFDPGFLRRAGWTGALVYTAFLSLVVLNLIGGFQALGTLMAVGLMMLPAAAAGFWSESAGGQIAVAIALTIGAALAGLVFAFHAGTPPESSIVLTAGVFYLVSLAAGPRDSIGARLIRLRHLEA